MAGAELIIHDDDGNIIFSSHKRIYESDIGNGDSDTTEGSAERFRHKILKDIYKDLLNNAQRTPEPRI